MTPQSQPTRVRADSWAARRPDLVHGLILHFALFAAGVLVLFLLNSSTRGSDGEWWVIWPLQLWAMAWGLHIWGVSLAVHHTRDNRGQGAGSA